MPSYVEIEFSEQKDGDRLRVEPRVAGETFRVSIGGSTTMVTVAAVEYVHPTGPNSLVVHSIEGLRLLRIIPDVPTLPYAIVIPPKGKRDESYAIHSEPNIYGGVEWYSGGGVHYTEEEIRVRMMRGYTIAFAGINPEEGTA